MTRRRRLGKDPQGVNPVPCNYKTQQGLFKALCVISDGAMDMRVAIWLQNAQYALVNKFGWPEKEAAVFVSRHYPTYSAYRE